FPTETVRAALDLDPEVPLLVCDARDRSSVRDVLVAVVEHALERAARDREPVAT
ncbi:ATP-binding protein, partial [Streptomyces globisporus]